MRMSRKWRCSVLHTEFGHEQPLQHEEARACEGARKECVAELDFSVRYEHIGCGEEENCHEYLCAFEDEAYHRSHEFEVEYCAQC